MQGKAIHYYREALERDPHNLAAISGEGEALVEKGAVEKARRNLAQLEGLCGDELRPRPASSPPRSPAGRSSAVLTAEAVTPAPVVTRELTSARARTPRQR